MKTPIRRNTFATEVIPVRTSGGVGPTVEEIRQRAYEIFLARGGTVGNELDDWLRAEQETQTAMNMKDYDKVREQSRNRY